MTRDEHQRARRELGFPTPHHPALPALTKAEFEQIYRAELARTGSGCSDDDVASSWRSYELNPAGHWMHGATR